MLDVLSAIIILVTGIYVMTVFNEILPLFLKVVLSLGVLVYCYRQINLVLSPSGDRERLI